MIKLLSRSVLTCSLMATSALACPTDLDGDGSTGFNDLLAVLAGWGTPDGDVDGNGNTDFQDLAVLLSSYGDCDGPTLDEPFHMPTMTDTSTLDVVVVQDWHVDTIDGTTRQKLIHIHVDDWWDDHEIRVPVRLIVPLTGSVEGFVISGKLGDNPTRDKRPNAGERVALDGGVGVVLTKIKSLGYYQELPPEGVVRARFAQDLDWRYSEYYLWGAIMMRSITAAFDDDLIEPGPVIAYGNSKNGLTPLVAAIQDERITAARSTRAFASFTPIRAHDPVAVAEVTAANKDFEAARADGLLPGDQPWDYYYKGFMNFIEAAGTVGWSEADVLASIDRIADDLYVSENWDALMDRGVDIFYLPGSHDWVAYDVPGVSNSLPGMRTYIVPNGGHGRAGHPQAPSEDVDAAFFAEHLFGADGGLEIPNITATLNGAMLDVTVTFPEGGEPELSRIFWMYDRGPDGSSWYLYELFPDDNWADMIGSGSTVTASIPIVPGHTSIDLVTTHTVTVDGQVIPISAPYTRVALD